MITREEVLAIEEYCAEHKVTHKARLAELGIQFWDFYKAKKKYREEDSMDTGPGQFVQLSSGRCVRGRMPAARTPGRAGKQEKQTSASHESYLVGVSVQNYFPDAKVNPSNNQIVTELRVK